MHKSIFIGVGFLVAGVSFGCETAPNDIANTTPSTTNQNKLSGTTWQWRGVGSNNHYINFLSNGHIDGLVGCNKISGVYEETSEKVAGRSAVRLGHIISTEMACPASTIYTREFLDGLSKAETFDLDNRDGLIFFDGDGNTTLSLESRPN